MIAATLRAPAWKMAVAFSDAHWKPILCSAAALTFLLVTSEKNKYYPAMPLLSAGCFLGYGLVYLLL